MERRSTAAAVVLAVVLQLAVATFFGAGSARAAVGPADDRQLTSPTGWATYHGVTVAQITSYLSANSARLTSIQVESATPTFTVTMVQNAGSYASNSAWYHGLTEAQVNSDLASNHARPISISAYSTSSGVRYAVVMVPNSGANQKPSWWYHGSSSFIAGKLTTNHARLITLQPFPGGGYTAIMVDNTGSNNTAWWWYHGVTAAQVNSGLGTHHARVIDVSRTGSSYNVVMYAASTRANWYFGLAPAAMLEKANQLGQRIISAFSYRSGGALRQVAAMTENLNAASRTLFTIISSKVDSGAYGFYLKQVGSSTLASLQSTKQYEPAGALTALYHAESIHREALGFTADDTVVTYHYNNADPSNGDICPDDFNTTRTTVLKNADTLMMQSSDNRMARAILEKYTENAVLNYATSLGLAATEIHHNIGCRTPHNKTTLVDLGKVYEAFQNGTVTAGSSSIADWDGQFRSRMLNELNSQQEYQALICPIVSQEATALGKSAATATAFCDAMTWIAKDGNYQYAPSLPYSVSRGQVSLTGVPYKSSTVITPSYFIFGEFVDGTVINGGAESKSVNSARDKLYQEALRPYIHAALATW